MRYPTEALMVLSAAATLAFSATVVAGPGELRVSLGTYSASNTNDAQANVAIFDLAVVPVAQSFTVDTCDTPTGTTYLRVYDEDGNQVASGSSGCLGGSGTRVSVTSTRTQRFEVAAGCAGASACTGRVHAESSMQVQQRWAPVVYQDTWPGNYYVPGDYITNFNFDGDYVGINNFNNADDPENPATTFVGHVYYSHVETVTHHFIGYYFFHPQDRSCDLNQHENDLEGILLAVRKVGIYGDLIAMQTEAHGKTFQYVTSGLGSTESPSGTPPDGSILILPDQGLNPATQTIIPMPFRMAGHPKIYSQPGGHGVWACGDSAQGANCNDNDGVVYAWQGGNADDPHKGQCDDGTSGHFDHLDACGYRLVSLDDWGGSATVADPAVTQGFWVLQNHICPTCTFHTFTNFNGNGSGLDDDPCGAGALCTCTDNAPNPPWQWADHNGVGNGDWLADPARFFDIDFEGPEFSGGRFSHDYVRHPYYTHELRVTRSRLNVASVNDDLIVEAFVRGSTSPSSPNESAYLTPYHWTKHDPAVDTWYPWAYGADDAEDENDWSQPGLNRHRFIRQTQERQPDGTYANGGRATRIELMADLESSGAAPLAGTTLGPSDWSSGSCGGDDDRGCVTKDGNRDYCRVQVNDFTCNEGVAAASGNVEFKLTRIVRPSAPPIANAGPDQTVECASPGGTTVTLNGGRSSDPEGDPLTYAWSAPGIQFTAPSSAVTSGRFPLGATKVMLAVSDGTTEVVDTAIVTIADTTPPSVVLTLTPAVLRPPKHQLVSVTAGVDATDSCDAGQPNVVLASITSSEPDNGMGDGDTPNDIQDASIGTDDRSFRLRAERSGTGPGRTYRVVYAATDSQGRVTTVAGGVTVPVK